ncbi:hypothetical protein ACIPZC_05830 [Pseudomonas sp. NPDC089743]|uniref:hypothetical protein n=1 Tax=Pseudomonas sp. NPDC089743 TaxID=3364471 RepID=UPI0038299058
MGEHKLPGASVPISRAHHIALSMAHRWFAFFEAPGGGMGLHLTLFHPNVQLSGHRLNHMFANEHESLQAWFAAVPDEVSSHHIIHSSFSIAGNGDGLLDMIVAYQAPGEARMQGAIISYETRIDFASPSPRFIALDKTPILPNTKERYETSWAVNRVLARLHAALGGITDEDDALFVALGHEVQLISAVAAAPEGSPAYDAVVSVIGVDGLLRNARLHFSDNVAQPLPTLDAVDAA